MNASHCYVIPTLPVVLFFKSISAEVDSHKYCFILRCGSHAKFLKGVNFSGQRFACVFKHMTGDLHSIVHDVSVQMRAICIDTALTTPILRRRSSLQIARSSLCPLNTVCDPLPPGTGILSYQLCLLIILNSSLSSGSFLLLRSTLQTSLWSMTFY